MTEKINLAYITTYDAQDIHYWSGTGFFIAKALEKQNINVRYLGDVSFRMSLITQLRKIYHSKFAKDGFLLDRDVSIAKKYSKEIQNRISPDTNVLFSPGSIPMSMLKEIKKGAKVKKVFYTDATFASVLNYYPEYSNYGKYAIMQGHRLEKIALQNCDLAIYSSEWAAQSAIKYYGASPHKIKVVPFGANIEISHTKDDIAKIVESKAKEECNLLFIGVDWERKGGGIALETAKILHNKGMNVHLDIVGIKNYHGELYNFITNHGFISKSTEEGKMRLCDLLRKAHFLILPTRNESFGIVFCEASAFGVPSIATNTGGVPSAVTDFINGKLFELTDNSKKYAEYIEKTLADFENYKKLCFSSFAEYKNRLNWEVAGKTIIKLIEEIL
jgi:glycosyltransferase involved in cell wall biosynthesis